MIHCVVLGKPAWIESRLAQMAEDAVDDVVFEDEREDGHVGAAARTSERIDFEDALQELGPAASSSLDLWTAGGVCLRVARAESHAGVGEDALSSPRGTASDGVGAVVAHVDVVLVGDVHEEPCEKLERREVVCAGSGSVALVGDDADVLSVVVHALEGQRSRFAFRLNPATLRFVHLSSVIFFERTVWPARKR